jgi:hypothetical protein
MTGFSGERSASPLLFDVLSELYKPACFPIDPGLHLTDLLELYVLTPLQGLGPQLAPAGCQREMRAQGDRQPLAYQGGCFHCDLPDRRRNIRDLGCNPHRQGHGHRQNNRRGSGHMRT